MNVDEPFDGPGTLTRERVDAAESTLLYDGDDWDDAKDSGRFIISDVEVGNDP